MVSKRWTWPTIVAVLFAGLTNAHTHVHYCFDGQEPPASMHVAYAADHDHDHELLLHEADGADHDDLDVDVPNQALAKTGKYDAPAIAPAFDWQTRVDTPRDAAFAVHDASPPAPDPHYRQPPARGPPV